MATVDMAPLEGNGSTQSSNGMKHVYVLDTVVDLAEAIVTKGGALASSDVIQALNVPAGSILLGGGAECIEAMTGTSTDLTIDIGITGGDVDNLVDGWDFDGAAVGAIVATGVQAVVPMATADTIDLLFVTQTGTVLTGKIRVFAILADISGRQFPGLATLGS